MTDIDSVLRMINDDHFISVGHLSSDDKIARHTVSNRLDETEHDVKSSLIRVFRSLASKIPVVLSEVLTAVVVDSNCVDKAIKGLESPNWFDVGQDPLVHKLFRMVSPPQLLQFDLRFRVQRKGNHVEDHHTQKRFKRPLLRGYSFDGVTIYKVIMA